MARWRYYFFFFKSYTCDGVSGQNIPIEFQFLAVVVVVVAVVVIAAVVEAGVEVVVVVVRVVVLAVYVLANSTRSKNNEVEHRER